jgi:hypothetical protein
VSLARDDAALLADWALLNRQLPGLGEATVRRLLAAEVEGRCRAGYVGRLHGRYCVLRQRRERRALLGGAVPPGLDGRGEE